MFQVSHHPKRYFSCSNDDKNENHLVDNTIVTNLDIKKTVPKNDQKQDLLSLPPPIPPPPIPPDPSECCGEGCVNCVYI